MRAVVALVVAVSTAGCTPFADPTPATVVAVTLGEEGSDGGIDATPVNAGPCPADNRCVMTAHVCLEAAQPSPSAVATLHLSSGTWLVATVAADPTSAEVIPGASCVDAPFRVGTAMGTVIVQASVGGYTSAASAYLPAAPVGEIAIVSSPLAIPVNDGGAASTFAIEVTALAQPPGLALSDGTRLELAVTDVVPAGESVEVSPDVAVLDEAGVATTSVLAGAAVTSFTLQAKAVAADGTALGSQSETIGTPPP